VPTLNTGGAALSEDLGAFGPSTFDYSVVDTTDGPREANRPETNYVTGHYNVTITGITASGTETYVMGPDETAVLQSAHVIRYKLYEPYTVKPVPTDPDFGYIDWYCKAKMDELSLTFVNPMVVHVEFTGATITSNPTITWEAVAGNPVMGFYMFVDEDGLEHNLCFDTKRAYLLNATSGRYENLESQLGDVWLLGDEDDHFWCHPYGNILTINNGQDPPYKYDPNGTPTIATMATNFDGTAGDDIDAAKMFFNVAGYGVYLRTKESATWYNGRARYTSNGDAEVFNAVTDFLDSPANDVIQSAALLEGDLYVGFRDSGWWKLAVTNDAFAPFEWQTVDGDQGAAAQGGSIAFPDRVISRSLRGFYSVSRMAQRDEAVPLGDLPKEWSQLKAYHTEAAHFQESNQAWWTYASAEADTPDNIMAMQVDPTGPPTFSVYTLPMHSIGVYRLANSPTWNDIEETWNNLVITFDSADHQSGFPRIVGGDMAGRVWEFDGRNADMTEFPLKLTNSTEFRYFGAHIPLYTRTVKLNPFPGQRVRLGWVDIVAEPQPSCTLEINFRVDWDSSTYKSVTVDLDPSVTTSDKIVKRIAVDKIAKYAHVMELRESTQSLLSVDSIIPWFKAEGEARGTV